MNIRQADVGRTALNVSRATQNVGWNMHNVSHNMLNVCLKECRICVQDPAFLIEKVTEMNTIDYQMQVLSLEGYTVLQLRYSFTQDFDLLLFP